jgi:tRNA pseudouridine55 synthase
VVSKAERRAIEAQPGGLVIVDKAAGMTSHDVVSRMRKIVNTRRVGHAGTLDPMATGVLVVGVNRATRLLHHLLLSDKAYTATMRFGLSTTTDDADGDPVDEVSAGHLDQAQVVHALAALTGDIAQVPSSVSAIKVDGQRAYDLARAGETVTLAARQVTVGRLDVTDLRRPTPDLVDVDVDVECTSGTYVRALARDAGVALSVGAHLTALRRTRVGPFDLSRALTLEQLAERPDPITLPLPAALALTMPVRSISALEADDLTYGRALAPVGLIGTYGVLDPAGRAVALLDEAGGRAQPVLVFTGRG